MCSVNWNMEKYWINAVMSHVLTVIAQCLNYGIIGASIRTYCRVIPQEMGSVPFIVQETVTCIPKVPHFLCVALECVFIIHAGNKVPSSLYFSLLIYANHTNIS
jgi:hypothetical protein